MTATPTPMRSAQIAELIALESAREPELRDRLMSASLTFAKSLNRADERAKTTANREWADCRSGIDALREELPRALERERIEREADARTHKAAARERLGDLLKRLGQQKAAIVAAYEDIFAQWRDVQQTLAELRQVLGFSALFHANGGALSEAIGDARTCDQLEAQFWRIGAQVAYRDGQFRTEIAPGAHARTLHLDHRHNPDTVPSLAGQHRDLTHHALVRFDGEPLARWLPSREPVAAAQSAEAPETASTAPADAPALPAAPAQPAFVTAKATDTPFQTAEPGRPELPRSTVPTTDFSAEDALREIAGRNARAALLPLAREQNDAAAAIAAVMNHEEPINDG